MTASQQPTGHDKAVALVRQAATEAAMQAMHCKRAWQGTYCSTHNLSVEWTGQGCGYAVRVADAVLAAATAPLQAAALRDAADEFEEFAHVDDERFKTVNTAAVRLNAARILRHRADRIEAP